MSKKDELYKWLDTNIPLKDVRDFIYLVLDNTPSQFWIRASSSSGKYHHTDEHGLEGLVIHTIRVCQVGKILWDSTPGTDYYVVAPACALHDIEKYPAEDSIHTVFEHPQLAADLILRLGKENNIGSTVPYEAISAAVRSHTGRWSKPLPVTKEEWLVHYADNIATKYI